MQPHAGPRRTLDIGANLVDPMFQGIYHAKKAHEADLVHVLQRAQLAGVVGVICTCGAEQDWLAGVALSKQFPRRVRSTLGIHPTEASRVQAGWEGRLEGLLMEHREHVVAIGECGLDADRTSFSSLETQRIVFASHFRLCRISGLPMFIHSRACHGDMIEMLTRHRDDLLGGGVVHSFDGSRADLDSIVELGLHVGVNGCSLKTAENLAVVKEIPVERLLVESDAPWCGIKPTHASFAHLSKQAPAFPVVKKDKLAGQELGKVMVKDRNEPVACLQVLEVVASVKDMELDALVEQVFENSARLFKWEGA